jgi:acylphosphatase
VSEGTLERPPQSSRRRRRGGGAAGGLERGLEVDGRHAVYRIPPMRVRKRIRAHGRVQGVFFRDSVRRAAEAAGVAGWARNDADGTVEAVFEGEPEAVDRLVDACRRGPGHARVDRLDVTEEPPEGLDRFEVG